MDKNRKLDDLYSHYYNTLDKFNNLCSIAQSEYGSNKSEMYKLFLKDENVDTYLKSLERAEIIREIGSEVGYMKLQLNYYTMALDYIENEIAMLEIELLLESLNDVEIPNLSYLNDDSQINYKIEQSLKYTRKIEHQKKDKLKKNRSENRKNIKRFLFKKDFKKITNTKLRNEYNESYDIKINSKGFHKKLA